MAAIVIATVNARYVHAALGLRYLAANLGSLRKEARIIEFVSGMRAADMAEQLLLHEPRVIGLGVYIWNVEELTRLVATLKAVAPEVTVVVGGPEVSFETQSQRICALADYVVTGWGDSAFARLCRSVLAGEPPPDRIIEGGQPALRDIRLPYDEYTAEDLEKRFVYVEASRGCPYRCEFCLSSLDRTAWAFDTDAVLNELARLHARGARHFRFVDRTFNLKASVGVRILEFFLACMDERLFVHFEVVPDQLPEALKAAIARFPPGALQFEVGIQTWNPEVQTLISRRQDNERAEANLAWLRTSSNAFIHADLIAGLPGEDLESFARGFDRLYRLRPHEIQVGILKRLRGAPIARHTETYAMRYNPEPPYNVLKTRHMSFTELQRLTRFARYWEIVANSGRFPRSLPLITADAPFASFMRFAEWLYARTGKTHEIALERLYEHLYAFLTTELVVAPELAADTLGADFEGSGARGRLAFLPAERPRSPRASSVRGMLRQARHLQNEPPLRIDPPGEKNGRAHG
jgi:radical SAM superfamily enzyme YgiQ (UPF0313 family)